MVGSYISFFLFTTKERHWWWFWHRSLPRVALLFSFLLLLAVNVRLLMCDGNVATSNDPWGPTGMEMSEIAALTFSKCVTYLESLCVIYQI